MQRPASVFAFFDMALGRGRVLRHHDQTERALLEAIARRHRAQGTNWRDGGVLVAFETGTQAIRCAFDVMALATDSDDNIVPRAGIDVPVDPEGRDESAAVAQALSRKAGRGEVLVSATARALIRPEPGIALECRGNIEIAAPLSNIEAFRANLTDFQTVPDILSFDRFAVDPARQELRRDGQVVPLEPRTFDLLLLLTRNSHRMVSREEIHSSVWNGRIVSDTALSTQIKVLRQALGDSGNAQHTVGTIHGRGFRFLRKVTPVAVAPAPDKQPGQEMARPVLVVLPFENLSPDNSGRFFADGISEDILNALGNHRWIGVIARNPSFAFRDPCEPLDVVAGRLGATHVVAGSLRKTGERIRICAEAIDARSMRRFWAECFEIGLSEIFDFQDRICGIIATQLATELGIAEQKKARRIPRENRGAWELYHLGMGEFYRFTPDSNRRAQEFLRMAIRADPDFAAPYTRLAYAITLSMVYFERAVTPVRLDDALDLAVRGLERDDRDPQSHFALGRVRLARQEYDLAIDALEHALELNPHLAVSHCGLGDSLTYEGRLDESIRHFERAIELSPHDPFRWAFYSYRSLAHIFAGDFDSAVRAAGRAVQVPNAHHSAHANLLSALGYIGDREKIDHTRESLLKVKPNFTLRSARDRLFYLKSRAQLDRYLEGLARAGIK